MMMAATLDINWYSWWMLLPDYFNILIVSSHYGSLVLPTSVHNMLQGQCCLDSVSIVREALSIIKSRNWVLGLHDSVPLLGVQSQFIL